MASIAIQKRQNQRMREFLSLEKKLTKSSSTQKEEWGRLVELPPKTLLGELKEGKVLPSQILKAFQWKALDVTKKINCITQFIPEAEEWASVLDEMLPESRGPLFGLPVSIKENIDVQGMDSTIGLSMCLFRPATEHAVVVKVLLAQGAIPFCKTNIPQLIMSNCCSNPIYGVTCHPNSSERSPGGSSGGEAALIAKGGSHLGFGTDVGGSVRVPASNSGCVGLKPTPSRISYKGLKRCMKGMVGNNSVVGVLASNVWICTEGMRILLEGHLMTSFDRILPPIPWRQNVCEQDKKLRIGYFDSFDFFPSMPGARRAIRLSKEALEKEGHALIPFTFEDVPSVIDCFCRIIQADQGGTLNTFLENEVEDPSVFNFKHKFMTYVWIKSFVIYVMKFVSPIMSSIMTTESYTSQGLWKALSDRNEHQENFVRKFQEQKLDLLMYPAAYGPPMTHYIYSKVTAGTIYTFFANLFDLPSGSVPVTKETEEDQRIMLETYPMYDVVLRIAKQDAIGAVGLPLAVQLTGLPYQDELVLNGMKRLEEALEQHNIHKYPLYE